MKFKIGIAEKRVVSHEQIIGLSPSTGRTRDDHGLGNGPWAQGIPRKNGSPRICTPHGHENGPCFRLSPWTDVVFAGRRNDWFAVHSSRPAHSLDGTATLTEERFQQSAASRVTAVGSCAGTVYLHCRCNARQSGGRENPKRHSPRHVAEEETLEGISQTSEIEVQKMSQLYVRAADHAVRNSDSLSNTALHEGILC
jgi:hypothetical protein